MRSRRPSNWRRVLALTALRRRSSAVDFVLSFWKSKSGGRFDGSLVVMGCMIMAIFAFEERREAAAAKRVDHRLKFTTRGY